jgi:hypothetical protein
MKFHSLRRTSPMGEDFLGTCVHCNKENLSFKDMNTECEFAKEDDFENDLIDVLKEG